jgi:hypothetical protein
VIAKTFETWSIDPSLPRLFLYWLARLSDTNPIPIDNLSDEYLMLRTTQEAIGEDSILFGYFALEWAQLQERCLLACDLPRGRNQAAGRIKTIALHLLEQCHECWLLHNTHLHGIDPRNTCSYKHLHLIAQVTALYESAPHMLTSDRNIFEIPLDAHHLQSKATLQSFYSWAQPVVKLSIAKALEMGAHFPPINQYFRPHIPLSDVIFGSGVLVGPKTQPTLATRITCGSAQCPVTWSRTGGGSLYRDSLLVAFQINSRSSFCFGIDCWNNHPHHYGS